jgi:hypothetical protein
VGEERYRTVDKDESENWLHLRKLSSLAAFFTFSAMGNNMDNVPAIIPRVEEVFRDFLGSKVPQKYPQPVNLVLAGRGQTIFKRDCAECHGKYSDDLRDQKLLSFPNKLVLQKDMGTDPYRWSRLDSSIPTYSKKNAIGVFVDSKAELGGYVAPILSGTWSKAPYMHNGSVPSMWTFMNPELRPNKFRYGGHAIDLTNLGVSYPNGYTTVVKTSIYDTTLPGRSNKGHEKEFQKLSIEDKKDLIEYLKLL